MKQLEKLSKDRSDYYLFLVKECFATISNAEDDFDVNDFASCTTSLFTSVEFFWKSLTILSNRDFNKRHEANRSDICNISKNLLTKKEKEQIIKRVEKFLNDRRELAKYGYYEKGRNIKSPLKQFTLTSCKKDLNSVMWLVHNLRKTHYCQIFGIHPIKIAVMSGYVNNNKERRCTYYPWSQYRKADEWMADLAGIGSKDDKLFDAAAIRIADLNMGKYPIVINPFGEAIPEKGGFEGIAFKTICRYIRNGGIFINSAGHPFIYGWDVNTGRSQSLISFIPNMVQVTVDFIQGRSAINVQETMSIPPEALLLKRIFGLEATWDIPSRKVTGEREIDIQFAKLLGKDNGKAKAKVYRPAKSGSPNTIPLVKSSASFWGNVYPVTMVKFGRGFLIHTGLSLNEEREYKLLLNIITRLFTTGYKTLAKARLISR